jgi:hypothetical protein
MVATAHDATEGKVSLAWVLGLLSKVSAIAMHSAASPGECRLTPVLVGRAWDGGSPRENAIRCCLLTCADMRVRDEGGYKEARAIVHECAFANSGFRPASAGWLFPARPRLYRAASRVHAYVQRDRAQRHAVPRVLPGKSRSVRRLSFTVGTPESRGSERQAGVAGVAVDSRDDLAHGRTRAFPTRHVRARPHVGRRDRAPTSARATTVLQNVPW